MPIRATPIAPPSDRGQNVTASPIIIMTRPATRTTIASPTTIVGEEVDLEAAEETTTLIAAEAFAAAVDGAFEVAAAMAVEVVAISSREKHSNKTKWRSNFNSYPSLHLFVLNF